MNPSFDNDAHAGAPAVLRPGTIDGFGFQLPVTAELIPDRLRRGAWSAAEPDRTSSRPFYTLILGSPANRQGRRTPSSVGDIYRGRHKCRALPSEHWLRLAAFGGSEAARDDVGRRTSCWGEGVHWASCSGDGQRHLFGGLSGGALFEGDCPLLTEGPDRSADGNWSETVPALISTLLTAVRPGFKSRATLRRVTRLVAVRRLMLVAPPRRGNRRTQPVEVPLPS